MLWKELMKVKTKASLQLLSFFFVFSLYHLRLRGEQIRTWYEDGTKQIRRKLIFTCIVVITECALQCLVLKDKDRMLLSKRFKLRAKCGFID